MKNKKLTFSKKKIALCVLAVCLILFALISRTEKIESPDYGVSFNTLYADELNLDWKEVYDAMLGELGVKRVRLAAHWNMVEKENGKYSFEEMDYQVQEAAKRDVEVIFAVGKRLPRWPECHVPEWAQGLSKEEMEAEILEYIETFVKRYEKYDNITTWQVENEPFLGSFALEYCNNFDKEFLQKEIDLVRSLDSKNRPVMVTDSGELSTWRKPFNMGDTFGTTLYVYSFNGVMGAFRNPVLPSFYSFRTNLWRLLGSDTEPIIAELALEPWLDKPVVNESMEVLVDRMSPEKFETVIEFAKKTGMRTQYLWGAEWWYYMREQGNDWYWERGKELFTNR